ncbi:MAG: glycosyltransferase family 4 protein [Nitrospirota bacterium]
MRDLIATAEAIILCKLPVPVARKKLTCTAVEANRQYPSGSERQLLVDVSTIIQHDARTGIQRVVRALLLQLLNRPPAGFRVRPVFATRKQGYHYTAGNVDIGNLHASDLACARAVAVQSGDIFLGVDLTAHILPKHKAELVQWKRSGVKICLVVHDLLPVLHPNWFNPGNTRNIHRWLRMVAIFADTLICTSYVVKADLNNWLLRKYSIAPGDIPLDVVPLGADMESSMPSKGLPANIDGLLQTFSRKPTILMVGTLEPRKGHGEVLAAFNDLWKKGRDVNLVMIGNAGWMTESLIKDIRSHSQLNNRLHWLENASDEMLEMLYLTCTGVIAASYAEGYGLPIIEAMYYQKPVLARDIPVFREIAGEFASYFSDADALVQDLEAWLHTIISTQTAYNAPKRTWQNSADELMHRLGLRQQFATQSQRDPADCEDIQPI